MFLRLAASVLLCLAAPSALAQPVPVTPPSPFEGDPHGVYDGSTQCWVWDPNHKAGEPMAIFIVVGHDCGGKVLEGAASVHWVNGRYAGQNWDGQFSNGRFSGTVARRYSDASYESHYDFGVKNGRTLYTFNDGGTLEQYYAGGLLDGLELLTYSDGTRQRASL